MTRAEEYRLSQYQHLGALREDKSIDLVRNQQTGLIGVQKVISSELYPVYLFLKEHTNPYLPVIYECIQLDENRLLIIEEYETGKNLDFASIEETDKTIQDIAEKLNIAVGKGVCYTIDTSSQPHYVFQYEILVNGMPLAMFDGGSYSDNVFTPGTYLTAVLDEDGIRHFDVSYVLKETETGDAQRILTLDEALDKVDEKYNSIIMEGDYYINDIQMAYTPIKTDDTKIVRLIPVWYFQTTHQILVPNRSGTGKVMLPQSGYILINALDGTELLHSNGDI